MTVVFWGVVVPLAVVYIAALIKEYRIQKQCREAVEEFLNREE